MKKKLRLLITLFLSLAFAVNGLQAEDKKDDDKKDDKKESKKEDKKAGEIEAKFFIEYGQFLSKGTNGTENYGAATPSGKENKKEALPSGFNLSRAYVTYKNDADKVWKGQVTIDGAADVATSYINFVKFGYVTGEFVQSKMVDVNLNLGLFPTAWTSMADKYRGIRFVQKTDIDDVKWETTSDLGAGLDTAFMDKMIDLKIQLTNGEGFKGGTEYNSGKAARVYLGANPKAGPIKFKIGTFYLNNSLNSDESNSLLGGGAGLDYDGLVKFFANYFMRTVENPGSTSTDGNLLGLFLDINLHRFTKSAFKGEPGILFQYYTADPDSKNSSVTNKRDDVSKLVVGAYYRPDNNVAVALDYQRSSVNTPKETSESKLYLHTEFVF